MKIYRKFFRSLLFVLLVGVICQSCVNDTITYGDAPGTVTLTLSTGGAEVSRAGSSGSEENYNEDLISTVDFYLFPQNSNSNPVHATATPNASGTANVSFTLTMEQVGTLFPSGATQCDMYIMANLPAATAQDLESVKPSDYNSQTFNSYDDFRKAEAPDSFIMKAEKQTLNYNSSTNAVTPQNSTIMLTRLAAKMRVAVNPAEVIYTDAEGNTLSAEEAKTAEDVKTYFLASDRNIRLFLNNGVAVGRYDGNVPGNLATVTKGYYDIPAVDPSDEDYELSHKVHKVADEDGDHLAAPEGFPYYNLVPYYSYPNSWENSSSEQHRTYMTLQIVWDEYTGYYESKPSGATHRAHETYYTIPVNTAGNCLESNHYYRVRLNVSMVGSFTIHDAVEIADATCEVEDWVTSDDINVNITDSRFLIVEQSFDMGVEDLIEIPYYTSHNTIFRAINPPTYTVKVSYSNANEPSTKITNISTIITSSGKVLYWGSGTISMETSSSAGEHTYKDSQNDKTFEHNNYYIYTCELKDGYIVFYHRLRGLTPMGGDGTDDNAEYFVENGKDDGNSYSVEIRIMHEDMKGNTNMVNGMTEEDRWTRTIFITQSISPVQVSTIDRNIGGSGTTFTVNGSYGFWLSYVQINGVSSFSQMYTDRSALETHLSNTFGGFGLPYSVLGEKTSEADKAKITRDLYILKVSSIAEDGKTVDVSYENNWTSPDNPNALTERDEIEKQRLATVAASTETKTVGSKIYTIGDPRSHNINNKLGVDNSNAPLNTNTADETAWRTPSMASGYRTDNWPTNGTLKYYYPTKEDGSVSDMVAPKFIVSSSFGEVTTKILDPNDAEYYTGDGIDRTTARRRCSAYQELLYPAGRWRLPTKAEFELVAYMYSAGTMMMTFEPGKNYWTADGLYTVDANGNAVEVPITNEVHGLVRCVYDDWYWTDKVNSYRPDWPTINFMWGDRKIER